MQPYLYYFFEYVVFFLLVVPIINELVFLFYPSAIVEVKGQIKTDIKAARATWQAQLTGAAFAITVCGLFTSQSFLFWMYMLLAIIILQFESWKPSLKSNPWFVRLDGLLSLVILSMILLGRFYYHQPFIQYLIFWIGSPPEEVTDTILRAS